MSTAEIIAELPRLSSVELAKVQAKLKELVDSAPATSQNSTGQNSTGQNSTSQNSTSQNSTPNSEPVKPIAGHPALGIWKDRTDLPDDSVAASKLLRERMMRRTDTAA